MYLQHFLVSEFLQMYIKFFIIVLQRVINPFATDSTFECRFENI